MRCRVCFEELKPNAERCHECGNLQKVETLEIKVSAPHKPKEVKKEITNKRKGSKHGR